MAQPRAWVLVRDEYNQYEADLTPATEVVCIALTISAAKHQAHMDAVKHLDTKLVHLRWEGENNEKKPHIRTAIPYIGDPDVRNSVDGVSWTIRRVEVY